MWQVPPARILVAVDFGEASATAVWLAGSLAARFGAQLTVLHAETLEAPVYFTRNQLDLLERERVAARAAAEAYTLEFASRHAAAAAVAVVVDGPAADAVLARMPDADLTVLGTHGLRGARRWWLGSVAERVVRAATTPVLVVHAAARGVSWEPARVVALGPSSPGATRWAEILAHGTGATVERIEAVESCPADALASASLVILSLPATRTAGRLAAPLPDLLISCPVPMLFVPAGSSFTINPRREP